MQRFFSELCKKVPGIIQRLNLQGCDAPLPPRQLWDQRGSLVLFISALDTHCFYNQSKSYANLFLLLNYRTPQNTNQLAELTREE